MDTKYNTIHLSHKLVDSNFPPGLMAQKVLEQSNNLESFILEDMFVKE